MIVLVYLPTEKYLWGKNLVRKIAKWEACFLQKLEGKEVAKLMYYLRVQEGEGWTKTKSKTCVYLFIHLPHVVSSPCPRVLHPQIQQPQIKNTGEKISKKQNLNLLHMGNNLSSIFIIINSIYTLLLIVSISNLERILSLWEEMTSKYYTILCLRGFEHLQILVPVGILDSISWRHQGMNVLWSTGSLCSSYCCWHWGKTTAKNKRKSCTMEMSS